MTLKVISAGIVTLQDRGRFGHENVGVGRSGAWNRLSYGLIANFLRQDDPAVFEILAGSFEITTEHQISAVVIGKAEVFVNGRKTTGETLIAVDAGRLLRVVPTAESPVYLGIDTLKVEKVLGSASFDTLAKIGPSQVAVGDEFEANASTLSLVGSFISRMPRTEAGILHFIPGPAQIELPEKITVSASSRSGTRFETIEIAGAGNLPSIPVISGCIQLTASGEPIILGPDCGTTGGYQVAGVVIESDLHKLAKLRIGETVRLVAVSPEHAGVLNKQFSDELARSITRPTQLGSW